MHTMKAIIVREHGDTSVLKLEHVSIQEPQAHEVRIRIKACAFNHLDVWVRKGVAGHHFPLPLILGSDIAGVVDATGSAVTHLRTGDEVVICPGISCGHCKQCVAGDDHYCSHYEILGEHRHGGYAEYIVVPSTHVFLKPKNLSFEEAACFGVAYLTAWQMLNDKAQLKPFETVLVHAAGSGVGIAAIQIAKMMGAYVIATSSSADKCNKAKAIGADEAILNSDPQAHKYIKHVTSGAGVDVIIEHVGASTFDLSLRVLAKQGRLVTCGATSGDVVQVHLKHLFFKSQSILGSTMGSKSNFLSVLTCAEHAKLKALIQSTYHLNTVNDAHEALESRSVFGKLVLTL